MSYRVIHRPARTTRPARIGHEVSLEAPPVIDQSAGKANLLTIVPLLGAATSMTVMMLFRGSPFAAVGALMMIVTVMASIVLLFTQRGKARRDREVKRDSYLEYLDEKRREFALDDERLRAEARVNSPEFELLPAVVSSPDRVWEPGTARFGTSGSHRKNEPSNAQTISSRRRPGTCETGTRLHRGFRANSPSTLWAR